MQSRDLSKTGHTILVVDDEPVVITILEKILSADGHTVHSATSGQEGIKKAKAIIPDLILMDVLMPDMDGYEVTARIKALPDMYDIPIIFLTGKAASDDGGRSFAVGGAAYLPKPFKEQQIRDVVNLAMKRAIKIY